ncbi:MAG: hemerythrin domain-containing protein [Candidatus Omnitrophica bacterium]|jgi:hemerythrin-like domain-containing protein|nr:hemerythrin domain-containing protein [Candidatus Omnitrophota bacterium]
MGHKKKETVKMLPVGQLMIEHRLIERLIKVWEDEALRIKGCAGIDQDLFGKAIDFMIHYADRCHHGKEEDILFKALNSKPLSAELRNILDELIREHEIARKALRDLAAAKERCASGSGDAALNDFIRSLKVITGLYPRHIEKEDKRFFLPCMEYFSAEEKDRMLEEFREFDRNLIHERYKFLVAGIESKAHRPGEA